MRGVLVKLCELVLVLLLDMCFCLSVAGMLIVTMLKRLFVVLSSSSLVVKRLLSAGNGKRSVLFLMVSMLSSSHVIHGPLAKMFLVSFKFTKIRVLELIGFRLV